MSWFRKTAPSEPLAVTMAGVKLGDRVLAIGVSDVKLIAALAVKAGLTGRAAAVDADEDRVRRNGAAIEREGALVEVTRAPWGTLPYESDSFDVVVLRDVLMTLTADVRARCLAEALWVLRRGGRVLVIEPLARAGLAALVSRGPLIDASYAEHGGAKGALDAAGFAGVRVLAEREGTIFVEGAKRASARR
jgi:ubiquinone/menaquinone biosynthesis C-methylase UbiE